MKSLLFLCCLLVGINSQAQHQLKKIWESDSTLAIPESVLPDKDVLYVSLIDGSPWETDGRGEIAKLDKNGKILNPSWVSGLNAPKGMGIWGGKLYVADVSEVAVITLATGKVESKIPIDGATGLNDITTDGKGTIYVSDSKMGNVHQIKNGTASLFLSNLKGVNGLKSVGDDLYILTAKEVYKVGADKNPTVVGNMEMGGDGIEPVGKGDFILSTWGGVVYYMDKNGKMETLLDTRAQKKNTADIGYDPAQRILYIPTFMAKSVAAYRLD
ncbi:SMP-30/gluconolactonase/LRE family protein [Spirosoma sp. KNUC1025]|uniref:SMP-30/gluconolactonase/LRE family protein n=1 Tax=Spirosoma sp. KNUC1025 TaxID=2894082 RepID=UPI003864FDD6|nr:ATP/GTP-binding protein [Spirosoma sp. KNUC1025]